MKHRHAKSGLFLFELIFAILFFALASAVCVRLFAEAHLTSLHSRDLSQALTEAQSAAECFKASPDDLRQLASLLGARQEGDTLVLDYGHDWSRTDQEGEYRLVLSPQGGTPAAAQITVSKEGQVEPLYTLEVKKYQP